MELHGKADDHGRVYQQGEGPQYNVENLVYLRGSGGGLPPWLGDPASWQRVEDVEPLKIGVHRAQSEDGNAVPPYIDRDIDEAFRGKLSLAAKRGGALLLVGDSTAGKSRAAYEAMVAVLPKHRIFVPETASDLRQSVVSLVTSRERCVVWLDNLEQYLGVDGITPQINSYLTQAQVVLLATLRAEQFRVLRQADLIEPAADHSHKAHRHDMSVAAKVLDQIDVTIIERRWSNREIERAAEVSDSRIRDALAHQDTYGIAEYLAAGPKLMQEWKLAWTPGANPRGAAMVSAAVDMTRAGLAGALPLQLIESAHEYYLETAGGTLLRPEVYSDALNWAAMRRYGITSLLLPRDSNNSYRPFDYLVDSVARDEQSESVPDQTWESILIYATQGEIDLLAVGAAAYRQKRYDIAELAWEKLANEGDVEAAYSLGRLFKFTERPNDAEKQWRFAAGKGNMDAATDLGIILEEQERYGDAETWLAMAASKNDTHAAYHLASVLHHLGRRKEAERWYRFSASEGNSSAAASGLGRLLNDAGRLQEAERWLRQAAPTQPAAAVNLGLLLARDGRLEEAEQAWRLAAEKSTSDANGRTAAANLGLLLSRANRFDEGETWLRSAIEAGIHRAAFDLAYYLDRFGRADEADDLLKYGAERGDERAAYKLSLRLFKLRRDQEAEKFLRQAADGGDFNAAYVLGDMLMKREDFDLAEAFLEYAAEAEVDNAACELGTLHRRRGRYGQAETWYRKSIEQGHKHSACLLGTLLLSRGRVVEAEDCYRVAIGDGHYHAAEMLAKLLARQGRWKEAANLRRMAETSGRRAPKKRNNKAAKTNRRGGGGARRRR